MNDCASAGENQIRGCSLSRAIGAITPQHSQHLIIFVKKSVAIPVTTPSATLNGILVQDNNDNNCYIMVDGQTLYRGTYQ
ncbi:IS256/ISEf1 family transposase [Enterococcus durans IPLA 655]|nr:IS256/ISEf1 family transposase [Enterococcus durans IPLA 655]